MVKTKFERVEVAYPDVAAFRIEGKLGFHENAMVQRLVEECLKRDLRAVVFDFSELASVGGGVAKILRDFTDALSAKRGRVAFVVTNEIIVQFLQQGDRPVTIFRSLGEAVSSLAAPAAETASAEAAPREGASAAGVEAEVPRKSEARPAPAASDDAGPAPHGAATAGPAAERGAADGSAAHKEDVIFMSYDSVEGAAPHAAPSPSSSAPAEGASRPLDGEAEEIITEIFTAPAVPAGPGAVPASAGSGTAATPKREAAAVGELNRQLKRRILELKTLFSISADFNAIWDRKKLLDIFLLTTIAQGGVESAVFLESQGEEFRPVMSKGVEAEAAARLVLASGSLGAPAGENNVIPLDDFAMEDGEKSLVRSEGFEYVCPFRTKDGFSGIVLLGKRIAGRGMKEEDFEFLRTLVNIAQGAYDNALMFEREHERTLGIVKTLISIIEENTLLKGTSEFVSRYVGMVAKSMDYPEDQFKDLIYGTVLRDMGMVKVSDLILRSPRDLSKEEWEIIKRHPEDGGEMLARMKFSEHVVGIVKTHHERFNGEGYPFGLRGKEIPLGSRIISVVESYAAMIHERPTRPALSEREALDTLRENYGLRYDREVVLQFARIMEKEIARSAGFGAGVPTFAKGTT
jgi:HD-GYP domain-containing protein (c-di-GMP phosphodiesterase class II)/anti-anti-sigma regulatory factor